MRAFCVAVGLHGHSGMATFYAIDLPPGRYISSPACLRYLSEPATCIHVTLPMMRCGMGVVAFPHWRTELTIMARPDSDCKGVRQQAVESMNAASGSTFACSCTITSQRNRPASIFSIV